MATKMRTGRMTVKTTTKAPGEPKKNTSIKPKVTTTPSVTVTGQRKFTEGATTAEGQWKEYGSTPRDEYYQGYGKKTKHQKLKDDQMKAFREKERGMGGRLLAKEVRFDPTDKAKPMENGLPTRYQVDYYNPTTEKAAYETESRRRYAEEGSPVMKTKKLAASTPSRKLEVSPKRKETVSKAIEAPGGKGRKIKNTPRVGGSIQKNKITKTNLNIKGQIAGAKFRKEEKLAGAYTRSKKYADQNTPEDVKKGANVAAGAFSKEKKAGYKSLRSDIKSEMKGASKLNVSPEAKAGYKKELKGALKDTRKSQKFEKKEQAGKTKYFNKSKMNETVEKRPSMKGRMQAGKMRYS
jgi:hypothetical protein